MMRSHEKILGIRLFLAGLLTGRSFDGYSTLDLKPANKNKKKKRKKDDETQTNKKKNKIMERASLPDVYADLAIQIFEFVRHEGKDLVLAEAQRQVLLDGFEHRVDPDELGVLPAERAAFSGVEVQAATRHTRAGTAEAFLRESLALKIVGFHERPVRFFNGARSAAPPFLPGFRGGGGVF